MNRNYPLYSALLASTLWFANPAQADETIEVPTQNRDTQTVNDGNITVTKDGQLEMTLAAPNDGDAIVVNSDNAIISLNANNMNPQAVLTTAAGRYGVHIVSGAVGKSATVNIGTATVVQTVSDAILINNTLAKVNNSGALISDKSAVHLESDGTQAVVLNLTGATMQGKGAATLLIDSGATALTLGNSGKITNNAITSNDVIQVNESFIALTNNSDGTMEADGNGHVINITGATPITGNIFNNGMMITKGTGNIVLVDNVFNGTILNTKTIRAEGNGHGINISADMTGNIENSGTMTTEGNGNVIHINDVLNGLITNNGTITAEGTGSGILIGNTLNGSVTNSSGATIQNTGGVGGRALSIGAGFSQINNSGIIEVTKVGDIAIDVTASAAGTINNNSGGLIQSIDNNAIRIGGDITFLSNFGTIQSTTLAPLDAVIASSAPVTLIGGIQNNGTISALNTTTMVPAIALDLQSFATKANFTQAGGSVIGDVLLAEADGGGTGNVFTMTGGTMTGDVTAASVGSNTLQLDGGTIDGILTLGDVGDGDIVNLAGTSVLMLEGGAGNDTFNVTGGNIVTSLNGNGGDNALNINNSFAMNGTISNVQTINVNNNSIFTVNNVISDLDTLFNITQDAAAHLNANVTGSGVILNDGLLSLSPGITVDMTGGAVDNSGSLILYDQSLLIADEYNQTATGTLSVQLQSPVSFGQIQTVDLGGVTLDTDSVITPFLGTEYIPVGTTFDIIEASGGGAISDKSVLGWGGSVVMFFEKSGIPGVPCAAGNCVQLTANRYPYSVLVNSVVGQQVGRALDIISTFPPATINPQILAVLGELDRFTSVQALDDALNGLAPTHNNALPALSRVSTDAAFITVQRRLEDMRNLSALGTEQYKVYRNGNITGVNYGDPDPMCCDDKTSASHTNPCPTVNGWIQGFGAILDQRKRNNIEGYLGNMTGYSIGFDWGAMDIATFGLAVSYSNGHTVGKAAGENVIDNRGWQFTLYGWLDPFESLYVDFMVGFASLTYDTRRNIGIGDVTTSAFAHFFGVNYGTQIDVGYPFNFDSVIVAPLLRFKYTNLQVDSYTEGGAGGLDLAVSSEDLGQLIVGAGLRVIKKINYAKTLYVPEGSAIFIYDFLDDPEQLSAAFLGAGNIGFPVSGIKPKQTSLLLGLGITAHSFDNFSCKVRYDLELKDHFFGHLGTLQLGYKFR